MVSKQVVKGQYRDLQTAVELLKKRVGSERLTGASIGPLYYPYWLVCFRVDAKMALGIQKSYNEVYLMVDGITGFVGYASKPELVVEELEERRILSMKVHEDSGINCAKEYVNRTFQRIKRLTMLKNLEINLVSKSAIYKQFWLVWLPGRKKREAWLLLDSVSGSTQFVVPSKIGIDVSSAK